MMEAIRQKVTEILKNNDSGHGMDHVNRVLALSLKFAESEHADKDLVALTALLHDVDDYKLFDHEKAKKLTNARNIMGICCVDEKIQSQVLESISCMGYTNLLKGLRPNLIEGKIVSDADMCDALGVNGVLRAYAYSIKDHKPFFNKEIFPRENMSADEYAENCAESSVCHIFEKILKLKYLMMTDSGKEEARRRHKIVVDILYHLFEEEDAPKWPKFLEQYLKNQEE